MLLNVMRLESSLWMLSDNPLDLSEWFDFDQSTWSQVVTPDLTPDTSIGAILHSRFKTVHEATKKIVADAQMTWTCRRYLDGDDPPWEGANLKHGCLVWDLVDNGGLSVTTSFGGDIFEGLAYDLTEFDVDSDAGTLSDPRVAMPDPNFPDSYYQSGVMGTNPSVPGVIFYASPRSGITTSEFSWKPATDVGVVAGGHSMPGVNELISLTVQTIGNLTALLPNAPGLGDELDTFLRPLYTDVFLAFGKWKDPARATRLSTQGFHYQEKFAEGADQAYTISWLLSMRAALWDTRETIHHKLTVADGASGWVIGQNGYGHFFLGDRVGSTVDGMPPGKIFIDRVCDLTLSWSRTKAPTWDITMGSYEPQDPVAKAWDQLEDIMGMLHDIGVI